MGLTLGAAGTSFPNLYASVLAARQGEAGMAIVQAFASNVFNVCIALGLLWLFQSSAGTCDYGGSEAGSCGGCFLPDGVAGLPCPGPKHRDERPYTATHGHEPSGRFSPLMIAQRATA